MAGNAVMSLFIILSALLNFVTPFVLKQIVDVITVQITGKGDLSYLLGACILLLADISATALTAYSMWIGDLLSVKFRHFVIKFYQHVFHWMSDTLTISLSAI